MLAIDGLKNVQNFFCKGGAMWRVSQIGFEAHARTNTKIRRSLTLRKGEKLSCEANNFNFLEIAELIKINVVRLIF